MRKLIVLIAASLLLASAQAFAGAHIIIRNTNTAGVGFNDTTPVAPLPGNSGTTIGQQRLIVFQRAAAIWGSLLESKVDILVDASFASLDCTANSASSAEPVPSFSQLQQRSSTERLVSHRSGECDRRQRSRQRHETDLPIRRARPTSRRNSTVSSTRPLVSAAPGLVLRPRRQSRHKGRSPRRAPARARAWSRLHRRHRRHHRRHEQQLFPAYSSSTCSIRRRDFIGVR